MIDLAQIFRDTVVARTHDPEHSVLRDLATEDLAAVCARARAAFPDLAVNDETFVRHLAGCVVEVARHGVALADLVVEDLYLACACLIDAPGAIAAFDIRCSAPIRSALGSVAGMAVDRDELEQQLRVRLLVGGDGVPPRIASYLGQGPLGRWVGVAAQRLAISLRRSDEIEAGARDHAALDDVLSWKDPGITLAKERFRAEFQRALSEALLRAADRDRLLLRLHFVNGMTVTSIARIYGVTQPTVSRWLQAARQAIADETQRLLRERVSLSDEEIRSLAVMMGSQLDLSISRLLDSGTGD
jgi:RNA polymerase sigma-70 factor (ECF subfamily)